MVNYSFANSPYAIAVWAITFTYEAIDGAKRLDHSAGARVDRETRRGERDAVGNAGLGMMQD